MVKLISALSVLALATSVTAGKYRLCACFKDGKLDETSTKDVVKHADGKYIYSFFTWKADGETPADNQNPKTPADKKTHGAPADGSYWHAIMGTINGSDDDGWIGAKEAARACVAEKATEGVCFTPPVDFNWRDCGKKDCFTSKAERTDDAGNPIKLSNPSK
ncbi:hypothetical protein Cob_v003447 [Colletotrichum orbiculare MAFF 240422]|uniref:Uncharacterized protein n=1 Tax=Colletotrichum orbiculare (strain 104-T / ATCC 96160 / CBS 514.97 / LARS 414 / MAFF 240422) TaxID=1213857 RepID=N4W1J2_COLOR|nr:hypothetical protein Cob_v003447 [Colletotrichum orbiculare MAFF 240422]